MQLLKPLVPKYAMEWFIGQKKFRKFVAGKT